MKECSGFIKSDILNERIGFFIKNKRKRMGMAGKELGTMLNVSQQQVSRYESGATGITVARLNDILNILDVSWEDFLLNNELIDMDSLVI
ncbi:helix-turn-helix domain-containing protein [Morganella morganii]|nr:helix-turn-helix transcriptional regulator [Morganella morganii]